MAEPNKERLLLWVEALESGNYDQGHCTLHCSSGAKESYCCLGVACKVAAHNGVEMNVQHVNTAIGDLIDVEYDGHSDYLPVKVQEWYGLDTNNPVICGMRAAAWNDSMNIGFDAIAVLVRHQYGLPAIYE